MKDINLEDEKLQQVQASRLAQYMRMLDEHYILVCEVDLLNDTYEVWYRNENATVGAIAEMQGTFSKIYRNYISNFSEGSLTREGKLFENVDYLREVLRNQDRYTFSYRSQRMPGLWVQVVLYATEYTDGECSKMVSTYSYVDIEKPPIENIASTGDIGERMEQILGTEDKEEKKERSFGLRNRVSFYKMVDELRHDLNPGTYCIVSIDIEHFKLFNKWYGREKGDEFLKRISRCLISIEEQQKGIAGYFGGDNFAIFMPYDLVRLSSMEERIRDIAMEVGNTVGFLPAFGVYVIGDTSIPAVNMYDSATMALARVIGNYEMRSYTFSDSMVDEMEAELKLISEIKRAMDNHEFTFYIQPQYHMVEGKIVGGEALVRWIHPEKGLVPPAVFIPVLEKNGLVSDVDRYVWEEVCRWMQDFKRRGNELVPISVNVSRMDVLSMDVASVLIDLTEKYHIDHRYLKVEITESAYAEDTSRIVDAVNRFHEEGFQVLMDDFGSGYSSLNMLRTLEFDVIKIDMNFLEIASDSHSRGNNILESVINMTDSLGVPLVIEGVEVRKQEDYLIGMGCRYAQGFYYSRPIAVVDFERQITDRRNVIYEGIQSKEVEQIHLNEFGDPKLFNDAILNNILGATAFYDICENEVSIIKVNNKYYDLIKADENPNVRFAKDFWAHADDEDRKEILRHFDMAYANPASGAERHVKLHGGNGSMLPVLLRLFFLNEKDGHKLFMGQLVPREGVDSFYDRGAATDDMSGEFDLLEEYYGKVPMAMTLCKTILDGDGRAVDYDVVYVNAAAKRMVNNDIGRMKAVATNSLGATLSSYLSKAYRASYEGAVGRHDVYTSASGRYCRLILFPYQFGYYGVIMQDLTKEWLESMLWPQLMKPFSSIHFLYFPDHYVRTIYPENNGSYDRSEYQETLEQFVARRFDSVGADAARKFFDAENLRNLLRYEKETEMICEDKLGRRIRLRAFPARIVDNEVISAFLEAEILEQ